MIELVQHKPADATGADGSVTFDNALGAGHLVIICQRVNLGTASVTVPATTTLQNQKAAPNGSSSVRICQRQVVAGDSTTFAFTHASAVYSIEAYEFAGIVATPDQLDNANGASATSLQLATAMTPAQAGELFIVSCNQGSGNGGTEAIDSGFTLVDAASFNRFVTGYKIKTDAAAENPIASWASVAQASLVVACWKALKAAPFATPRTRRALQRSAA